MAGQFEGLVDEITREVAVRSPETPRVYERARRWVGELDQLMGQIEMQVNAARYKPLDQVPETLDRQTRYLVQIDMATRVIVATYEPYLKVVRSDPAETRRSMGYNIAMMIDEAEGIIERGVELNRAINQFLSEIGIPPPFQRGGLARSPPKGTKPPEEADQNPDKPEKIV